MGVVAPVAAVLLLALVLLLTVEQKAPREPAGGQGAVFTDSVGIEFVAIPGGTFTMGSPPGGDPGEQPAHEVHVQPFLMSRYEITQAQWEAVMGGNPSLFRHPQRPVDRVTWLDVQSFIQALNQREGGRRYRLPTEAEWEYAARAGGAGRWFFGDDPDLLPRYAWFGQTSENIGTRPVGRALPNPWGLYDVYGNVWEWVQDCYHENYQGAPPDARNWPGGDCSQRMVRGGGWNSPLEYARSAVRGSYAPHLDDASNGFRLVLER